MAVIGVDLTELPAAVREQMHAILSRRCEMELIEAQVRQAKIKKFYEDNRPRWKDGFGPMVMSIDPWWMSYFSMKYGEDAHTPEFLKWVVKQEPMFQVRAEAPKTKVGWRRGLELCQRGHVRETKTYQWRR